MKSELINTEVKSHSCGLNPNEWVLSEFVATLYQVAEILNLELFNGLLTAPIITVSNMRVTSLGSFTPGRNDFGAKNHISINLKHLHRNRLFTYAILLHEMLHQSEYEIHKKKKANRGNYHSAFFCSADWAFPPITKVITWGC